MMRDLGKKISLFLLLASSFLLAGCSYDPDEEELLRGQKIDIEKIEGEVTAIGVNFFVGDKTNTRELKGQPYFWIKISYINEGGVKVEETFKGIPSEVREALNIGMKLPATSLLSLTKLTKMEGAIVDIDRNLEKNRFFVVIKDLEGINVYNIDMKTYYMLVHVGTKLPLDASVLN